MVRNCLGVGLPSTDIQGRSHWQNSFHLRFIHRKMSWDWKWLCQGCLEFIIPHFYSQGVFPSWNNRKGRIHPVEVQRGCWKLWALSLLHLEAFGTAKPMGWVRKTWNNQARTQKMNRNEGFRQAGVYPATGVSDQSLMVSPEFIWGIFSPFG